MQALKGVTIALLVAAVGTGLGQCGDGASHGTGEGSDGGGDVRLSSRDGGLGCQLGGGCTIPSQCVGPIEACADNCQCLAGIWRMPCPMSLAEAVGTCALGAYCSYTTPATECGSENCYCEGGVWNCFSNCIVQEAAVGPD